MGATVWNVSQQNSDDVTNKCNHEKQEVLQNSFLQKIYERVLKVLYLYFWM